MSEQSIFIDPSDRRYPIWGERYLCRIPRIETLHRDHFKVHGAPTVGNRQWDAQIARERVEVYITIDAMVEYQDRGVAVAIVRQVDLKKIYEACENYLKSYGKDVQQAFYYIDIPLDDLAKIERFTQAIFEYAKYEYGEEFVESQLLRHLNDSSASLRDFAAGVDAKIENLKKPKNQQSPEPVFKDPPPKTIQRESLMDLFTSYMQYSNKGARG